MHLLRTGAQFEALGLVRTVAAEVGSLAALSGVGGVPGFDI